LCAFAIGGDTAATLSSRIFKILHPPLQLVIRTNAVLTMLLSNGVRVKTRLSVSCSMFVGYETLTLYVVTVTLSKFASDAVSYTHKVGRVPTHPLSGKYKIFVPDF